jgi:SAM-dependent methyltransferase
LSKDQVMSRPNTYARRTAYRPRFYRDDYFVLKHLTEFINSSLRRYVVPGSRVADIGCGEQPLRAQIEGLGATYTGVDIEQNPQQTVEVVASITDLPLTENSFDTIICTEVLEHVSDTYTAFGELARVLRPGGHLVISVPFGYPLHEEPYDYVRLTPYQIRECAAKVSLTVTELRTTGNELEVLATLLDNMWRRGIKGTPNFFQKRWISLTRIVTNLWVKAGVALFGRKLPGRYYLNAVCVLTK